MEALDAIDWQNADVVLSSLVSGLANATRMEESTSWRYPFDLVAILENAFEQIPIALETGRAKQGMELAQRWMVQNWTTQDEMISVLLGEDAQGITDTLLTALQEGCTGEQLAQIVTYTAALRVARFNTNNDFNDWNSAHHPFTFANAVHQGLRRLVPSSSTNHSTNYSIPLLRGVFDAAMNVHLNRFLNVPPARLPEPNDTVENPEELLPHLADLLDIHCWGILYLGFMSLLRPRAI